MPSGILVDSMWKKLKDVCAGPPRDRSLIHLLSYRKTGIIDGRKEKKKVTRSLLLHCLRLSIAKKYVFRYSKGRVSDKLFISRTIYSRLGMTTIKDINQMLANLFFFFYYATINKFSRKTFFFSSFSYRRANARESAFISVCGELGRNKKKKKKENKRPR